MWTQAVTSIEKVTDKFEPGKSQNVNHNSATNPAPRLAGALKNDGPWPRDHFDGMESSAHARMLRRNLDPTRIFLESG
jgi:hypothetical protein